jgi:predicted nucleic-acid-binding protein
MESLKKVVIDTNTILRFLLNDNEEQSKQVSRVLANADCIVPVEVITEAVFVLSRVYFYGRKRICEEIRNFAKIKETLLFEKDVVCHACNVYVDSSLDFVDCLIDSYAKIKGYHAFTFDKKLIKILGERFYNDIN